nr:hypothetical protein [Salinicola rhizosphaerae]
MMTTPDLITLALLSPGVFKLMRDHLAGSAVLPGEALEGDGRGA